MQNPQEFKEKVQKACPKLGSIVYLNVGGDDKIAINKDFLTKQENSILAKIFLEKDFEVLHDGRIFIDRDPEIFKLILNFLRNDKCPTKFRDDYQLEMYKDELEFWGLEDKSLKRKLYIDRL